MSVYGNVFNQYDLESYDKAHRSKVRITDYNEKCSIINQIATVADVPPETVRHRLLVMKEVITTPGYTFRMVKRRSLSPK